MKKVRVTRFRGGDCDGAWGLWTCVSRCSSAACQAHDHRRLPALRPPLPPLNIALHRCHQQTHFAPSLLPLPPASAPLTSLFLPSPPPPSSTTSPAPPTPLPPSPKAFLTPPPCFAPPCDTPSAAAAAAALLRPESSSSLTRPSSDFGMSRTLTRAIVKGCQACADRSGICRKV